MKLQRLALALSLAAVISACVVGSVTAQDEISPRATRMNTFHGPTGLLRVPTAFVAVQNNAQYGVALRENERAASVTYGITDYAEIGATIVDQDGRSNKAIVSGKINVIPSNIGWFQLGLGAIDPFDVYDDSYYIVASTGILGAPKGLEERSIGLRLHLGYGTGIYREDPIGGAELFLDERFSAIAEYDGDDFNFGLRYSHRRQPFRILVGVADTDFFLSSTVSLEF